MAANVVPARLLGYLASQRGDLFVQGEVLATLGLTWVLRNTAAKRCFEKLLEVDGPLCRPPA